MYPYRNERVATRTIDGEAVIVSPDDSMLHTLNEVGTCIWEMSDGKTHTKQIIEQLVEAFDVKVEQARSDVEAFCRELSEKSVLTLSEHPQDG